MWVFKDCLDTWPPRRVKKTFIKRESSYFVEDLEILLIKIQMTDTILNLLLNLQRKFLILTTWILLRTIHSFIHHFCAVAMLRKYKGLKKVRTKIIQSFPVIKINIAFLKHIMNILKLSPIKRTNSALLGQITALAYSSKCVSSWKLFDYQTCTRAAV